MRPVTLVLALGLAGGGGVPARHGQVSSPERVRLRLDTAEAVAVLKMIEAGAPADGPEWERLLASDGYRRLKAREAAMRRPLTDSAFAAFLRADRLIERAPALRRALTLWERTDLHAA